VKECSSLFSTALPVLSTLSNILQICPGFEIGNEIEFVKSENQRLRLGLPKITVARK
jgi:hypothetical protein